MNKIIKIFIPFAIIISLFGTCSRLISCSNKYDLQNSILNFADIEFNQKNVFFINSLQSENAMKRSRILKHISDDISNKYNEISNSIKNNKNISVDLNEKLHTNNYSKVIDNVELWMQNAWGNYDRKVMLSEKHEVARELIENYPELTKQGYEVYANIEGDNDNNIDIINSDSKFYNLNNKKYKHIVNANNTNCIYFKLDENAIFKEKSYNLEVVAVKNDKVLNQNNFINIEVVESNNSKSNVFAPNYAYIMNKIIDWIHFSYTSSPIFQAYIACDLVNIYINIAQTYIRITSGSLPTGGYLLDGLAKLNSGSYDGDDEASILYLAFTCHSYTNILNLSLPITRNQINLYIDENRFVYPDNDIKFKGTLSKATSDENNISNMLFTPMAQLNQNNVKFAIRTWNILLEYQKKMNTPLK